MTRPRWYWTLLLAALALGAGGALWGASAYPGMTRGLIDHARYATLEESRNLWLCNRYWLDFMARLSRDPASEMWTFEGAPRNGLPDDERGVIEFHRGRFADARSLLLRSLERSGDSERRSFWLAMSEMRLAESANCLQGVLEAGGGEDGRGLSGHHAHGGHGGRDLLCTLPLLRAHGDPEPSRRAMEVWTRLLDRHAPEDRLYRWLLNFSAMTVDEFPDGVPQRYRIDTPFIDTFYGETARRARARHPELRFTDRARELGVENFGAGRGAAVEDFDRDGDLDLVATGAGFSVRYYRNEAGTGFADRTAEVGLEGLLQPFTVSAADFDGDGWIDLFVSRPYERFALLRNRGGRFEDVTEASGLTADMASDEIAATWVSAWGDLDNDGDLDLFLANWAFRMPLLSGLMARPRMDPKLFLNDGTGRFRDAGDELGIGSLLADRFYVGAAFGDYDGDGFADLFLSSPLRGWSRLLHNDGGRRLRPAEAFGRTEPGFVGAFLDADQDGRLDVFHAGFGDARTAVVQAVFGEHLDDWRTNHSALVLQTEDGRFVEREGLFGGGTMPMGTMGANYGDLDNDGCFDFYLGTGNPEPWFVLPNLLYLGIERDGRCTGELENVSMLEGFGNVQKGHGIVFFDFDGDGDQDVFSSLGGMWPADQWVSQLFVNESDLGRSWTAIRLRGRRTNYYGVGARLAVTARRPDGTPLVRYRQIDHGTGFGSSPLLAHVGLLDAVAVEGVEVYWPASRCRHVYPAELGRLNLLDEAECLAARGEDS